MSQYNAPARFASIDLAPAKPRRKSRAKARPATGTDNLRRWSKSGIGLTLAMSALLNAYAYVTSLEGPTAMLVCAVVALGIAIPLLVLISSEVAGILWHRRQRHLAYATCATGAWLLALSVWHCACAVSTLTHSPIYLALPMAVAIDAGLVCCKLALLVA